MHLQLLKAPGGSLTHIVYKTGLPSTLTKFRALQDPKPKVVGIGWVVDCVEKREKVDTARYEISLEEEAGSILDSVKPTKVCLPLAQRLGIGADDLLVGWYENDTNKATIQACREEYRARE